MPKNKRSLVAIPQNLNNGIVELSEFSFLTKITDVGPYDLWLAQSNSTKRYYYAKQVSRASNKRATVELFEQLSRIETLKHPFILGFAGVTMEVPYTGFTEALGKNIRDILERDNSDAILSGTQTTITALCIADAMSYIHKKHISVPHFSAGSIFILDDMTPRISLIEEGCIAPPRWIAPELYFKKKDPDEKTDVFLYGFFLFELLTGYEPFTDLSIEQ